MLQFISVYTICKDKKDIQTERIQYLKKNNLTPLDMYIGLSKVYCNKPEGIIH